MSTNHQTKDGKSLISVYYKAKRIWLGWYRRLIGRRLKLVLLWSSKSWFNWTSWSIHQPVTQQRMSASQIFPSIPILFILLESIIPPRNIPEEQVWINTFIILCVQTKLFIQHKVLFTPGLSYEKKKKIQDFLPREGERYFFFFLFLKLRLKSYLLRTVYIRLWFLPTLHIIFVLYWILIHILFQYLME